ncbi:hypothetical protein [Mycobacterium sp. NAZ190054]|uniref:hypothetical protein n=1 Tax=Mycobacterium sp. NAZ190054 TaxID=1747766 RepID=UPI001E3C2C32|nr:hypothetical protein [Mycobacterium sp. NAZ190054]
MDVVLTAIALVPSPPVLVPELASSAAAETEDPLLHVEQVGGQLQGERHEQRSYCGVR